MMNIIACPRHGIVDVAKDLPCPECGVAAYDLNDPLARDVVGPNREAGLKMRKLVAGAFLFVTVSIVASIHPVVALNLGLDGSHLNLGGLIVGGIAAALGARPLALKMERNPRLRRLDEELGRRRV